MNARPAGGWLLLALSLWGAGAASAAQNFSSRAVRPGPQAALEKPLTTHQTGETLVFDVHWMGVHVGYGKLEVRERVRVHGREAFHVVATAETNEFLSKIYPVRDEIHSFIDVETLHSLEFRKKLSEARYRADEHIVFDTAARKGRYESFLNGGRKEIDIPVPVHDLVSAFYWFRLQPAKPGDVVRMRVNSEEKDWDLEIHVLGRERKEFRGRALDTLMVEPKTRLKGILYARGRALVYFSPDERRVPVWITLRTPWGHIVGVLRDPPAPPQAASGGRA